MGFVVQELFKIPAVSIKVASNGPKVRLGFVQKLPIVGVLVNGCEHWNLGFKIIKRFGREIRNSEIPVQID